VEIEASRHSEIRDKRRRNFSGNFTQRKICVPSEALAEDIYRVEGLVSSQEPEDYAGASIAPLPDR